MDFKAMVSMEATANWKTNPRPRMEEQDPYLDSQSAKKNTPIIRVTDGIIHSILLTGGHRLIIVTIPFSGLRHTNLQVNFASLLLPIPD